MESGASGIINKKACSLAVEMDINIGLQKIERKLYGLTSVLSNKIMISISLGFSTSNKRENYAPNNIPGKVKYLGMLYG